MKISLASAIVAFSSYATIGSVYADDMQRQSCTSDEECAGATLESGPGDYCSTVDNTCVAAGECTALEDCTENMSNIFAVPMCIGDMYCITDAAGTQAGRGRCINVCMGTPSTCEAYDACGANGAGLAGECCPTEEGQFLACCVAADGTEVEDPIATDPDDSPAVDDSLMNEMFMGDNDAVVPGVMPADPTAGGGENPDSPVAVDDRIRCMADSDCNASPELDVFYCAGGTCLLQGGCLLDIDCVNPSNYGIKDTRCVGYLFCDTSMDLCERKCTGFQCPDDMPATECSVTGCDTRIACQGSVNCVVDNCDADCKGIFFDSSGTVLEKCTGGKGGAPSEQEEEEYEYEGEGVSMVGEPLLFTMAPTDETPDDSPVVADDLRIRCLSDSDCIAYQELDALYCAAGTCLPQGACHVDTDCVNPSNYGIQDTRCVGYLFCDTTTSSDNIVTPMCARKCTGFQCPGDVPATECSVTGCDTRIACQGSVNCVVDNCDAECKGIFFDSSGTVLEECTGGKGAAPKQPEEAGGEYEGEGVSMVGEPLTFTMAPTAADADMDVEVDAASAAETGGEEGVSMVGEPLVQTISPTPTVPPTPTDSTDVNVEAASSAAGADSTSTATAPVTMTTDGDEATTTTTTTTTAADGTVTPPATTATMDAAEAAASSAAVSLVRNGHHSASVSLLVTIVVVAMMSGLSVGLI